MEVDSLKSSRRLQAQRTAQKVRLQPIDYVDKSIRTQNEGEKNRLQRRLDHMDKDFKFKSNKMEGERKQFVVDQRRTLKPVFDGLITPSVAEESQHHHHSPGVAVTESAFPDFDSDMLRIVEYFEIHKPNTVKRIHTMKHLSGNEERQWLLIQKQKQKAKMHALSKIGSSGVSNKGGSTTSTSSTTQSTPKIHVDTTVMGGAHTHRGDMTDKERQEMEEHLAHSNDDQSGTAQGFYLSTGAKTPDVSSSLDSTMNSGHFRAALHGGKFSASRDQINESDDEYGPGCYGDDNGDHPLATTRTGNELTPINILPPTSSSVIPDTRPRYQSPPSTRKFRNHKVRTSMSDRGKLSVRSRDTSVANTPVKRKTKSFTPFSEDLASRTRGPLDSADVFGSADANFKAALTESNLKLHALNQRQNKTPRPETLGGKKLAPLAGAGSLPGSMENLTIDENDDYYDLPIDPKSSRRSPLEVQDENRSLLNPYLRMRRNSQKQNGGQTPSGLNTPSGVGGFTNKDEHTKAVHETIPENPRMRKSKPKLFKSRRYGDTYLVPSDVKRTCQEVPFDPYVLAVHKHEVDEIETRKRLKDINQKLKIQRQNAESIQSNVTEWVKTVDKDSKAAKKAASQANKGQSWTHLT